MHFSGSFECAYIQPAFRSFIIYNLRAFNSCFLDSSVFNHVHYLQLCIDRSFRCYILSWEQQGSLDFKSEKSMCMGFLPVALWVEEELVAIHEDETLKA